jgi:hypothetical protein
MPQEVLPVLLRAVDDRLPVVARRRPADPVLGVGEEVTPLRLEEVDHVQVLSLRLDDVVIEVLIGQKAPG